MKTSIKQWIDSDPINQNKTAWYVPPFPWNYDNVLQPRNSLELYNPNGQSPSYSGQLTLHDYCYKANIIRDDFNFSVSVNFVCDSNINHYGIFSCRSPGGVGWQIYVSSGTIWYNAINSGYAPKPGTKHRITSTYSNNSNIKIYTDGVLVASGSQSVGAGGASAISLGMENDTATFSMMQGRMWDFCYWTRPLSDSEASYDNYISHNQYHDILYRPSYLFNFLTTVNKDSTILWDVLTTPAIQTGLFWSCQSTVGRSRQTIWNLINPIGLSSTLSWTTRSTTAKDLNAAWSILSVFLIQELNVLWNANTTAASQKETLWNVRATHSTQREFLFDVLSKAGLSHELVWNVYTSLYVDKSFQWNVTRADIIQLYELVLSIAHSKEFKTAVQMLKKFDLEITQKKEFPR